MAIKVNNQSIQKIMLGNIPVKRIYEDMQIVFDTGGTPQPCFEVVDVISQASGDYVDVYVNNEAKWYKRNNLNQYEEYGIMPITDDLSTLTYYTGKLAILNTDVHEYKWNGSTWVDLGAAGSLTEYIFMDPPTTNTYKVSFPIRYYFGEGYKMKIFMYVSGTFSGDTGGFLNMANKSPIEFNQYSNGFYVDYHNPTSTTSPSVYKGDYSTRVMAQRALNNYKDTKLIFEIENNRITVTNFDTGAQIYTGGSLATVTGWYDGLYEPVYAQGNNNPSHVAYIQIYDNNGNLVNDLRPKYNENPSDVKDTVTWYDSVIQAEYYNDNSYAANYHKESIGDITPVEDYDTKVAPANNVHYNTLAELELMECPWYGMRASVGENYVWYKYTTDGWVLADLPLDIPYLRFIPTENSTFTFSKSGLKYSIDGAAWLDLAENVATPTVQVGHYIMFKGDNPTATSSAGIGTFSATGNFDASGNIMSLLFDDDFPNNNSLSDKAYAFKSLFYGNTYLKDCTGLLLPATALSNYCYQNMFTNSGVTAVSSKMLPATTMRQYCYASMFSGAAYLTTPPELPATTLASYCYHTMFSQSGLTTLPELPATVMVSHCYDTMFNYVNANIPENYLPSTQLAQSCYTAMFANSDSRTRAMTVLPATTLAPNCYDTMFINNTSLTEVPALPAEVLVSGAYKYMYMRCPITSIFALFTTTPSSTYTGNWVNNVGIDGTFYKNPNATWDQTITRGNDTVPSSWTITDWTGCNYMTFTVVDDNGSTFQFSNNGLEYSIDNGDWTTLAAMTPTPLVAKGHNIRFKGYLTPDGTNEGSCGTFYSSGTYNVSGTLGSLLYGDYYYDQKFKFKPYSFQYMFQNSKVVDASGLVFPLYRGDYMYRGMFKDSTYLVTPPPEIYFTSGNVSCSYMCFEMFSGCTSMTTVPSMFAGSFATGTLKSMFMNCTSIIDAEPIVIGTILYSEEILNSMFYNCSSLQKSPIITGYFDTDNVAREMFYNCSSLTKVTYFGNSSPNNVRTPQWLYGVSSNGTVYMSQNENWDSTVSRDESGVPADWTIVKIDPSSV